jgi:hypothetical protein
MAALMRLQREHQTQPMFAMRRMARVILADAPHPETRSHD